MNINLFQEESVSKLFENASYVQTFQTQTIGATMQLGSKSGCGVTLGATHVQAFDPQKLGMSLGPPPGGRRLF